MIESAKVAIDKNLRYPYDELLSGSDEPERDPKRECADVLLPSATRMPAPMRTSGLTPGAGRLNVN